MPLILGANSLTGGYEVDNSLRFNSGSSDYLNRTPASNGNRQIYTYSSWFKLSKIDTVNYQYLFSAFYGNLSRYTTINIKNNQVLQFYSGVYSTSSTTASAHFETNQVFRDLSSWYHLVLAVDTTQATSTNRVKIYLNGSQITSFSTSTYPSLNDNHFVNYTTTPNYIGQQNSAEYFNGYMSEVILVDGQALDPTSFGEFDEDSGIWKPIAYTGTYGTNGFYLEFKDSSALGDDTSGNSNDFTVNNLTSIDQTTDTPTNNFATLNPLSTVFTENISSMLSEGNTKYTPSGDYSIVKSTIPFPQTGKWYVEGKLGTGSILGQFGIMRLPATSYSTDSYLTYQCNDYCYAYSHNGNISKGSSSASTVTSGLTTWSASNIIAILFDADNNEIKWYNNDALIYTLDLSTAPDGYYINDGEWVFAISGYGGYQLTNINFGNPSISIVSGNSDANGYGNFEYDTKDGYALCTNNLAEYG